MTKNNNNIHKKGDLGLTRFEYKTLRRAYKVRIKREKRLNMFVNIKGYINKYIKVFLKDTMKHIWDMISKLVAFILVVGFAILVMRVIYSLEFEQASIITMSFLKDFI